MNGKTKILLNICVGLLASSSLAACGAGERLADVGKPPAMSPIENPQTQSDYRAVSMPMPAPQLVTKQKNSLWASDRQAFFEDQRADDVGDILTVTLDIKDKAELDNETERTREADEGAGLNALLGYEADLAQVLPETVNNAALVGANSESNHKGSGSIDREEKIQMKLAATIMQVLPNGNMVIQGRQEVRVNFEKRILEFAGVIRPQDITIDNTISYDKVAEARVSYGGKGQITDVQQPRYGQQVYDVLFPF
ncbi:MAG: flagellar basal body L-ring protein [Micavibrio aeruginosavorus]|uniref:Flagellar L-ring protein n=1 Tax=Micavibrio aeruginosavorus TaxID=349221 RepID=A0A2W5PUN1_9BACT|nr:MAG: flagellar basal body L-ring protein [Micavibrio aeruginosavorus]